MATIKVTRTVVSANQETCWIEVPDNVAADLGNYDVAELDELVTELVADQCPEIDEEVLDTVEADPWKTVGRYLMADRLRAVNGLA